MKEWGRQEYHDCISTAMLSLSDRMAEIAKTALGEADFIEVLQAKLIKLSAMSLLLLKSLPVD